MFHALTTPISNLTEQVAQYVAQYADYHLKKSAKIQSYNFPHSAKLAPTQCVALGCMQVTQTHESFSMLQHAATHCNTLQHNTGVSLVFIHMISRRET